MILSSVLMKETSPQMFFVQLCRDIYAQKYEYNGIRVNSDIRPVLLCACETVEIVTEENQDGYRRCETSGNYVQYMELISTKKFNFANDEAILQEIERMSRHAMHIRNDHANDVRFNSLQLMYMLYKRHEHDLVKKGYYDKEYTTRMKAALLALDYYDLVTE